MRGRKPKPTKTKQALGNPGKRPLNEAEPLPAEIECPPCPDWMSEDAAREWARVVPELHRLGLLTQVDQAAIEAHCTNYGRAIEAERLLARTGPTYESKDGPKKHPAATVAKECWQLVRAFLGEFGMSPVSRSRVNVPEAESQDELGGFARKR